MGSVGRAGGPPLHAHCGRGKEVPLIGRSGTVIWFVESC
jgi:hypothetical protein